jgi:DNA-binding NarL/FixJ family response regulator
MGRTLLIVDDHPAFRTAASTLLSAAGFSVVATAPDAATALALTGLLHPDVVLLDIQLPDMDGFAVAERLANFHEPPLVVLTSSRDADEYGDRLPAAGTLGYVPKRALSGAALTDLLVGTVFGG